MAAQQPPGGEPPMDGDQFLLFAPGELTGPVQPAIEETPIDRVRRTASRRGMADKCTALLVKADVEPRNRDYLVGFLDNARELGDEDFDAAVRFYERCDNSGSSGLKFAIDETPVSGFEFFMPRIRTLNRLGLPFNGYTARLDHHTLDDVDRMLDEAGRISEPVRTAVRDYLSFAGTEYKIEPTISQIRGDGRDLARLTPQLQALRRFELPLTDDTRTMDITGMEKMEPEFVRGMYYRLLAYNSLVTTNNIETTDAQGRTERILQPHNINNLTFRFLRSHPGIIQPPVGNVGTLIPPVRADLEDFLCAQPRITPGWLSTLPDAQKVAMWQSRIGKLKEPFQWSGQGTLF